MRNNTEKACKNKNTEIKEEITSIYHENPVRYGYRRVTVELHIPIKVK